MLDTVFQVCVLGHSVGLTLTSHGFDFPHRVCISDHDYPGQNSRIRFDQERPISLGEDGCTSSKSVIQKVFTAEIIATEYVEWPYAGGKSVRVRTSHTDNYQEVLTYMKRIFRDDHF